MFFLAILLENIGDDVGEVFGGDDFFFVAEFDDSVRDSTHGIFVQLDGEGLQVFTDIGFAGEFSECILADAAETFREEVVAVEVVFAVSIGMDAGALGEYVGADDGLIGRDADAGATFHDAADVVNLFLHGTAGNVQLIF